MKNQVIKLFVKISRALNAAKGSSWQNMPTGGFVAAASM